MVARVELVGAKRVEKFLRKYPAEAKRALGASLFREGREVERLAKQGVSVDLGILRASGLTLPPVFVADTITVTVQFGGPTAPYAKHHHNGTKPYWVPIAPLKAWAGRVLGDENLGYAVQWKIAQVGLKGTFYLSKPFEKRQVGLGARLANDMLRRLEARGVAGKKK